MTFGKESWPLGSGEMALRIREFEWSGTPLGNVDSWPQALRTLVDLMLDSQVIMALPWGRDFILLYNDAYSRLIGPRSPSALGRPVFDTLPELREVLEPHLQAALSGHTVQLSDQLYPFVRNGAMEDSWFDISHTPVRVQPGVVAGVLSIIVETTARVLSERQQRQTDAWLRERNAALQESEARMSLMLDSATEYAIITLDDEGRISGWNRGAERLLGYTEREVLGRRGEIFFTPEDIRRGEPEREMRDAREKGQGQNERWHVRKDGSRFWGSGLMTPMHGGPTTGYLKIFRDRTAERLAEARLRQSEERFRDLVGQVKDYAIFSADLSGRATTWNEGVMRVLGFTEPEFIGMDLATTIFTPEDVAAGVPEQEIATTVRDGVANNDRWMRRKDGRRFYALGTTTALKDERGNITGLTKVMRDHTSLKHAQEALATSEEQFRRAIEDAPIPVIMHAEDGEVLQLSRTWTALTGYRIDEVRNFNAWLGAYGFGAEEVGRRMRDLFGGSAGMVEVEFEIKARSGDRRVWAYSASSPGTLQDGRRFVVGMAVDITERKLREEQIFLLMKEVNHRAKNLLALMQVIARQTAASTPAEFVERFSERVQALAANQDLLVKSTWQGVDLGELVEAQLAHFEDLLGSRITIEGPRFRLSATAAQAIGLALHELATNAAKYGALSTDQGRVEIRWRLARDELSFSWIESGGRPVAAPQRQGFGSTVLNAMTKASLGGSVLLDYLRGGVRWQLTCPAENAMEPEGLER